jgi:hypothetical protein
MGQGNKKDFKHEKDQGIEFKLGKFNILTGDIDGLEIKINNRTQQEISVDSRLENEVMTLLQTECRDVEYKIPRKKKEGSGEQEEEKTDENPSG